MASENSSLALLATNNYVHLYNINIFLKNQLISFNLPWSLTGFRYHLLILIIPLVCYNPSSLPQNSHYITYTKQALCVRPVGHANTERLCHHQHTAHREWASKRRSYCALLKDLVYLQNRNNNKKYCKYPSVLPWVLTGYWDHLLRVIIPLVC